MKKLATLFLSSLILSLTTLPAHAADSLKLYVLDCGTITVNDLSMFTPGHNKGVKKNFSNSCYLISHPKGTLLWDTGLDQSIPMAGKSVFDGAFYLRINTPLTDQLEEIGVSPSDITYLALSHFHFDHSGNANLFTKATHLIQESEHSAIFSTAAKELGFSPESYTALKNATTIKFNGDYDVFGDNTVIIKRAIGHTPGHQALFVDLPKTGPLLFSGDLWHQEESRTLRAVPVFNFNKDDTHASMDKMEAFAKAKKARIIIQHDKSSFDKLKHAPAFYE